MHPYVKLLVWVLKFFTETQLKLTILKLTALGPGPPAGLRVTQALISVGIQAWPPSSMTDVAGKRSVTRRRHRRRKSFTVTVQVPV